jgi:hypothetical protein
MTSKTQIIEAIFRSRWNEETKTLSSSIVTLLDAQEAISRFNSTQPKNPLSTRNPANFFKDFIRKQSRANANWPPYVLKCGYTGRQLVSSGNCFEFIPLGNDARIAFSNDALPLPDASTKHHRVESVSLPLASKRLGRRDEPWLIQVLVKLRVFETHLALASDQEIVQLDHLQTNIKLAGSEIDALFLGIKQPEGKSAREVIICCEAKGRKDDIIPDQILGQVKAAFKMGIEQDTVIPLAVKAIAPSEIWLVEFQPVDRAQLSTLAALTVATSAIYHLVPPVKGIGE